MRIERARLEDLKGLSMLQEELMGRPTNLLKAEEVFQRILDNEDYYLLGAYDDEGGIIGSSMGIICYELVGNCEPFMVIENVIVSSKYRGQGIGALLMKELEKIAQDTECSYIMLVSAKVRTRAHKFYEDLGYNVEMGFKKRFIKVNLPV